MTAIAIIGGTGYTGGNIAREAVARGHRVTSFSRSAPSDPIDGVDYVVGSAEDSAAAIGEADVVVASTAARGDMADRFVAFNARLAQVAADAGVRFVVVGGFMSTRPAPGEPRFIEGDVPEEYREEAEAGFATLDMLMTSAPEDLDWLYVSPGAEYGPWAAGERIGEYRKSGDVALFDSAGKSTIGGEDFAIAVVDELESPTIQRGQVHFAY